MGGDENISEFFTTMYGNTFWNLILGCFQSHIHHLARERQAQTDVKKVERDSVLKELSETVVPADQIGNVEFSESYKKGSIQKR